MWVFYASVLEAAYAQDDSLIAAACILAVAVVWYGFIKFVSWKDSIKIFGI